MILGHEIFTPVFDMPGFSWKKLLETMSLKALFDAEDSMEVGRTLVYKFGQIQSGLFFHNL